MKKSTKIILIIIAILLIMATIFTIAIKKVVSLVNKEKVSISASEFRNKMSQKGLEITDANSQFAQYSFIKQVYIAGNKSESYQIEFYEFDNESYATGFYNNNASKFQETKGNVAAETNFSGKNYAKYTLSSNNQYMVISRVNNTVIYIDADSSYKNEIENILKEIDY